ncbi:UviB-like protein [Clostridium cadaveris]|uniref:BhlA/UviB family holin-like peptide n=1 Tax=Clostridium TaxID=1485 RepID=UPI001E422BC8|nr:BhlA/UviB family holin-like peptide [Clostridium cadaveris]MDU4950976.1 BhlA/UviB family holin-like peptide [Clostridium sp.]UFH63852.1 UviB-like protein [Clostridium cadaveris]
MDELLKASINQGLGYGMFVFLLLYVLKTTGDREKRYQDLLDKLTAKFNIVENVQDDVKEIKSHLFNK